MKIIINKVENKKDFMDECYGILTSYKRLLKNPNMHISKRSTKLIIHIIIVLTYFIAVTYSSIVYKKYVFYICLGISIMALAIAIAKIIRYTKLLNIQSNSKTDSILDIDEEKIVLDNKTVGTKYSVSWIDIKQILVSERSIIFMKKNR